MITRAAVKFFDKRQNKEIIIPCHRHCDAFHIMKIFGYCRHDDYKEIEDGFLDHNDNFLSRRLAYAHAVKYNQLLPEARAIYEDRCLISTEYALKNILFSEDLW